MIGIVKHQSILIGAIDVSVAERVDAIDYDVLLLTNLKSKLSNFKFLILFFLYLVIW